MINWDGKNFIALTATSSTLSLKYINYDGSSNNIPVATLHSDTAWNGAQTSATSSGSATNNDPITRNYSVTSGSKYYVRTGHTGPGGPVLLLYVTGATIATISESYGDYDVMFDSPTNGTVDGNDIGNYATLNPQHKLSDVQLLQGNLDVRWSAGNGHAASSTIAMSSGKWYFEVNTGANACMGIRTTNLKATNWPGSDSSSYGYATDGRKVSNSNYSSFGTAHQRGDIIGVAFDADNGKLWFSRNGTWQASGNPATGANPAFSNIPTNYAWYASVGFWTGNTSYVNSVNFGQRPWGYTPPAGFKALCTQNLLDPSVEKSSEHFDISLWNVPQNSADTTISGLDFGPDWLLAKNLSQQYNGSVYDTVRGDDKFLKLFSSNSNGAEVTQATRLNFTSDGYVFEADNDNANYNANSRSVGWAWNAGTSTVSNTDGDVTASVRANQTAGLSIVKWTNNGNNTPSNHRVGHGLGTIPDLVITKRLNNTGDWNVYSEVFSNTVRDELYWNTNAGKHTSSVDLFYRDSSTFGIRANSIGTTNDTHIAYVLKAIDQFSAIGTYIGNGSNDGNFIWTGFKVKFLMRKNLASQNWIIHDRRGTQ